jgi:hypothetical protein
VTRCPGCGLETALDDGPTHAYIGASSGCWAVYGEVLAREYSDPELMAIHQLTVDAYAAQHPGEPGRRSAQSVWLHLATLSLVLELGHDPAAGPAVHRQLVRRREYPWLEPPQPLGTLTVAHVQAAAGGDEHVQRVREWARDVWEAWRPHHATIRSWVDNSDS